MTTNKELSKVVDEAYHKNMSHPMLTVFNFLLLVFVFKQLGEIKLFICAFVVACIVQGVSKSILRYRIIRQINGQAQAKTETQAQA